MSLPVKKNKSKKDDFEKQFESDDTESEQELDLMNMDMDDPGDESDQEFDYYQDTEDDDSEISDVESCCSEQSSTSIQSNFSIKKKYIQHLVEEEVSD